jgi:hypothetical protein
MLMHFKYPYDFLKTKNLNVSWNFCYVECFVWKHFLLERRGANSNPTTFEAKPASRATATEDEYCLSWRIKLIWRFLFCALVYWHRHMLLSKSLTCRCLLLILYLHRILIILKHLRINHYCRYRCSNDSLLFFCIWGQFSYFLEFSFSRFCVY